MRVSFSNAYLLISFITFITTATLLPQMSRAKNLGHLVFVYGTLKRGEPNNGFLDDPAHGKRNFLVRGQTVEAFPLVVATEYGIPFLLDKPGLGQQVQGNYKQL